MPLTRSDESVKSVVSINENAAAELSVDENPLTSPLEESVADQRLYKSLNNDASEESCLKNYVQLQSSCEAEEDNDCEGACEFSSNSSVVEYRDYERPKKRLKRFPNHERSLESGEIGGRIRILRSLVPGGAAMDTVLLLDQTALYIKLLEENVKALQALEKLWFYVVSTTHYKKAKP